jgi:hypothetical protein
MTSNGPKDSETVLQVVRGERPWTDLRTVGMEVELEGNRCVVRNPRDVEVTANVHDLAKGFRAYLHDPRKLKEWAFVVEAADVDLEVEGHPAGDTLLNALWRASFGEPLGEDVVKVIEQLAS